jgi:LacI family transcriptional regulator
MAPMVIIPRRLTLVPQVAEALRRGIRLREWVGRMPAEAALASQLQVSRMTLRAGMKIMAEENRIRISRGRRAFILSGQRSSGRVRQGQTVGIMMPVDLFAPPFGVYYGAFCDILHDAGVRTRYYSGLRFYQRDPTRALEELLREAKVDFWVLTMSTGAMQRWFAHRQIPVMVDGSCQAGVRLAGLDVDYRAVGRHAAGVLLGLGHRRVVFLAVKSQAGGDAASEIGFSEGFSKVPSFPGGPRVVHVGDSPAGICSGLSRLFRSESQPTALFCQRTGIATVAMSYLTNRGHRVPRDFSLICRDSAPHMDFMVPSIARYTFKADGYARRLARMTFKHFEGTLSPEQQFILPAFARGDSIGPAPEEGTPS